MTHDPLCLVSKNSPVCLHCAGENDNRGKSNYCSDCWDHYVGGLDQFEPVHECECDLIAKVRADEMNKVAGVLTSYYAEPRPYILELALKMIAHDLGVEIGTP